MKYVVNNLQFQSQEDRAFRAFFVFQMDWMNNYIYQIYGNKNFQKSSTHLNDKYGLGFIKEMN